MVTGIDRFREWFRGYEDQYAIIGGTACDLLMSEDGMDFRATKDIDLVLIVEAITPSIGIRAPGCLSSTVFRTQPPLDIPS